MDIRKVKKLIEMLEESNISEIEIREGEELVRVSRHSSNVPAQAYYTPIPGMGHGLVSGGAGNIPGHPGNVATSNMHGQGMPGMSGTTGSQQTGSAAHSATASAAQSAPVGDTSPNDHNMTSPMVGTFYRAPSPNDKPFVDVGQNVKIGDTLCIIEAMKMLNQIEADASGKIKRILVENGQPVEFGQPLFIISKE